MSASDPDAPGPESRFRAPALMDGNRDAANEDFLFHLYRGSELLQDNRVLEAKSELEHALTLQPRDPKGQDLLAVVYFRIGLYPHAIQIYEEAPPPEPSRPFLAVEPRALLPEDRTGPGGARAARGRRPQRNPGHRTGLGLSGSGLRTAGRRRQGALRLRERLTQPRSALVGCSSAARRRRSSRPPLPRQREIVTFCRDGRDSCGRGRSVRRARRGRALVTSLAAQEHATETRGSGAPSSRARRRPSRCPPLGPAAFPPRASRGAVATTRWTGEWGARTPPPRLRWGAPRPAPSRTLRAKRATLAFPDEGVVVDGGLASRADE